MKTIELADASIDLPELLRLASEGNLILRTEDGKEFVLAEIDDFDHELSLIREQKTLMEFLDQRSSPAKTFTLDQVRETLGLN